MESPQSLENYCSSCEDDSESFRSECSETSSSAPRHKSVKKKWYSQTSLCCDKEQSSRCLEDFVQDIYEMSSSPSLEDLPEIAGLAVGKDKSGTYMTLPSPNVQNGDEQDGPNVFKKLSSLEDEESEHEEVDNGPPPASALHRRRALVPPKMLTDGYESATEENDQHSPSGPQSTSVEGSNSNRRRRSSIVVIPPMQICPGDLLVYSKVLTQRNTLLVTIKDRNKT